jgi:low affinity Fe/Cu permease
LRFAARLACAERDLPRGTPRAPSPAPASLGRAQEEAHMHHEEKPSSASALERLSRRVMLWTGGPWAFVIALAVIVGWALLGPIFHYSDTWQLVINTGTTIVTFLMVFLIQRGQNKDARAVALKLNEIVAAIEGASNRLIDVESLSEHELDALHLHYLKLVEMAKRDEVLTRSHSIEEAELRHARKREARASITPA